MSEFAEPLIGDEFGHARPNCLVAGWPGEAQAANLTTAANPVFQRSPWPCFKGVSALVQAEAPSVKSVALQVPYDPNLTAAELLQYHVGAPIYRGAADSGFDRPIFS